MGLFDEVRVQFAALRTDPDHYYQTKSLDDPCLRIFTITREGLLVDSSGDIVPFSGTLSLFAGPDLPFVDGVFDIPAYLDASRRDDGGNDD